MLILDLTKFLASSFFMSYSCVKDSIQIQGSRSIKAKQKNDGNKVMNVVIKLHHWEEISKNAKSLILLWDP